MSGSRRRAKRFALAAATMLAAPALASYALRARWLGADRALEGSSQALSLLPGVFGQFVRRAFFGQVLAACDAEVTIEFGAVFSQVGARLESGVYVGPRCHLGLVHLERDVLLGAGVHIPSGPQTHGTSDVSRPIRDQPGERRMVRIGHGAWVGSGAIVMADVGADSVIAAGSVVTEPVPSLVIAAGSPARVVKPRGPKS